MNIPKDFNYGYDVADMLVDKEPALGSIVLYYNQY